MDPHLEQESHEMIGIIAIFKKQVEEIREEHKFNLFVSPLIVHVRFNEPTFFISYVFTLHLALGTPRR